MRFCTTIGIRRASLQSAYRKNKRLLESTNSGGARLTGHPDRGHSPRAVAEAKTYAELETVMHQVVGPSDLMEFARIDLREVLRKEPGNAAPQSLRLVAGNPLIMK
jgi:hypothetical protein